MKILFIFLVVIFANICIKAQTTDSLKNIKLTVNVFSYTENFEYSAYSDFYTFTEDTFGIIQYNNDSNNIWQIASPNKENWNSGGSQYWPDTFPSKVLITDSINPYPTNNHSWFEIHIKKPEWAIQAGVGWQMLEFRFLFKCETDSLKDYVNIEISFDEGLSFANLLDSTSVLNANNGPSYVQIGNNYSIFKQINFTGTYGITDWDFFSFTSAWDSLHLFDVEYSIIKVNFKSDSLDSSKKGFIIDNLLVNVTDNPVIGIKEMLNYNYVSLYPNPINEISLLKFNNSKNEYFTLEILNYTGQLIYKNNTQNNYFEIGKIPLQKGIYIYKLYYKSNIIKADRLIKQ